MRKAVCILLMLLMTVWAAGSAAADAPQGMRVVNCSEWVSLRERPDRSSTRLARVPLGEVVINCAPSAGGFVACEYAGQRGYILAAYLEPVASPPVQETSGLPVLGAFSSETEADYRFDASLEEPAAGILYTAGEDVTLFQVLSLDTELTDDGTGKYHVRVLCTVPEMEKGTTVLVRVSFIGDLPENGIAYMDRNGDRHVCAVEMSGEDGSLRMWEIQAE